MDQQFSLFERSLAIEGEVKLAMNRAARRSPLSREQLCERMNKLAAEHGVKLAATGGLRVATLEKWLNPHEREHLPGLKALAVFCKALGSREPLAALAAPLGLAVIDDEEAKLLQRAKIDEEIKRLKRKKRSLED